MASSYYRLFCGSEEIYSVGAANGIGNIRLSAKADGTSKLTFDVPPTNELAQPLNINYVPSNLYDYKKPILLTGVSTNKAMFVGVFASAVVHEDGSMSVTCEDVLTALDSMYIRLGEAFQAKFRKGINKLTVASIMQTVQSAVRTLSHYTSVSVTYVLGTAISAEEVEVDMTARKSVLDVITEYVTGPRGLILLPYTATVATSDTTLRLCITNGLSQNVWSGTYICAPDTFERGKNITSMSVTRRAEPYNAVVAYGGKVGQPMNYVEDTTGFGRVLDEAGSVGDTSVRLRVTTGSQTVELRKGSYVSIRGSHNEELFYEVAIDDTTLLRLSEASGPVTVPIRPALQGDYREGTYAVAYPESYFSQEEFLGWTEEALTLDSYTWQWSTIWKMYPIGRNTAMLGYQTPDHYEADKPARAFCYENDAIIDHNLLLRLAYEAVVAANMNSTLQIEVNGIDPLLLNNPSAIGNSYPARVGAKYKVIDSRNNINVEMAVHEAQIDVCSPENSTFVFGSMRGDTSMAFRRQSKATREVRSRIQAG